MFFGDDMPEPDSLDEDLCPVVASEIDARATYLIDLRKPLAQPRLPGNLLRDVSMDIAANTELSVFALTENAGAPRQLLGKLCKPYANADLAVAGGELG